MFIEALKIEFGEGTVLDAFFIDGTIVRYDMAKMFHKYPQLKALQNRDLFLSGKLDVGGYGIVWNDELDFDTMSIHEGGEVVGHWEPPLNQWIGFLLTKTRKEQGLTQMELSKRTGIDQGDISKIEKGLGNPTLGKINRLFNALNKKVSFRIVQ